MAEPAGSDWEATLAKVWLGIWLLALVVLVVGFASAECHRVSDFEWECDAFGETFGTFIGGDTEPSGVAKLGSYVGFILGGGVGFGAIALLGFFATKGLMGSRGPSS